MENNSNRRDFLYRSLLLGTATMTPVQSMAFQLAKGLILKAQADVLQNDLPNYVVINMAGAPSRWAFDAILRTSENDLPINRNASVANEYVTESNRFNDTVYTLKNFVNQQGQSCLVPPLFFDKVRGRGNSEVSLSNLLNKMLVMRGYGTGIDGHPNNMLSQSWPNKSLNSIGGFVADYSSKTIPALGNRPRSSGFKAKTTNLIEVESIDSVIKAFLTNEKNQQSRSLASQVRTSIEAALDSIHFLKSSKLIDGASLKINNVNARKQIERGMSSVLSQWQTAKDKYKKIFNESINYQFLYPNGIPNITDKPILTEQKSLRFRNNGAQKNYVFGPNEDVRESLKKLAFNDNVANSFALAEVCLAQQLTSTFDIHFDGYQFYYTYNHIFEHGSDGRITNISPTGVANPHLYIHDNHATGSMVMVGFDRALFRGVSAGISELLQTLSESKDANGSSLDKKTFIHVTGDFNRHPRHDNQYYTPQGMLPLEVEQGKFGTGSDHGYDAMVTSVFSGAIRNGPIVVGNVKQGGNNFFRKGSIGTKADVTFSDGTKQTLTPVHVAATLSKVMGWNHNPWENQARSLVQMDSNGNATPLVKAQVLPGEN